MDIVSAIQDYLASSLGADRYDLWFSDRVRLRRDGARLFVEVPDDFWLDHIRNRFRGELESACLQTLGRTLTLVFVSRGETPQRKQRPRKSRSLSTGAATQPQQPQNGFASYVEGECNRLAVTAAKTTLERPGCWSPLFLYGPHGCGKTELLECLKQAARAKLRSRRVVMMSAEQFTSLFLEALHGSGLPNFRRKYRDLDMLLIDDVQFFGGKRATLVELHASIDYMQRQGRQLVFTSDRPPLELRGIGEELIQRFTGGLVGAMEPLDEPTRMGVLHAESRRRGFKAPLEVLQSIAQRMGGDARQLRGALNRLEAHSIAHRCEITQATADAWLRDLYRSQRKAVRMDDIEHAVCEVFGLDKSTLQSSSKTRDILQPRMLAMWLARKHTRAAYSEIGRYFGKRSHSTVISAQQKVSRWVQEDAAVRMPNGECSVQDAIQRIESQFRIG